MPQVLLDTNFIISCVRQKIYFFELIPFMGMEILIPEQVIKEIEKLSKSKDSANLREESDLTLKVLNRSKFKTVKLEYTNVDKGIKKFADDNPDIVVATLDKELKDKISNHKLIIRGNKTLELK